MEFVKNNPNLSGIALGQLRPEPSTASGLDIVSSAFGEENDVAAVVQAFTRPTFEPDPTFNIFEATKDSPYLEQYSRNLGAARSQQELDYITADIDSELKAKRILATSGWSGTLAAMGAGLLSPTMFIPLVGELRGAKGIAQTFALAAAAAGTQEAVLYGLHETRTKEQALAGVAIGTVLGGLLGSGIKYLGPQAAAKAASGMDLKRGEMTILHAGEDGSLKEVNFDTIRTVDEEAPDGTTVQVEEAIPSQELKANEPIAAVDEPAMLAEVKAPEPTVRTVNRVKAKDGVESSRFGGSFLRATVGDGVTAVFTKASGGTKWFVGGEYAITLLDREGKEISLPRGSAENHANQGNTLIYKQADLIDAYKSGKLDDQINTMLRDSGQPEIGRNLQPTSSVGAKSTKNVVEGIQRSGALGKTGEKISSGLDYLERLSVPTAVGRGIKRALLGTARAVTDPLSVLAKLNPVTRIFENKYSSAARAWMAKIHTAGLKIKTVGNSPIAGAGTVIDRSRVHHVKIADFVQEYDRAYFKYLTGNGDPKLFATWREQIEILKSNVNMIPAGKMTYREFGEEVFRLGNTGEQSADVAVMDAVNSQRAYYDYVNKVARDYYAEREAIDGAYDAELNPAGAQKLYDELEFGVDSDIQAYVHHTYDHGYLASHDKEFLDDFGAHIEEKLTQDFDRSFKIFNDRRSKLTLLRDILTMDEAGINKMFGDMEVDKAAIDAKYGVMLKMSKDTRKAMRAAGAEKEEIETQVKALEESFGPDYADAMKRRRTIDKNLSTLRKVGAGLTEKQQRALDDVEKLEDMQIDTLEQVASRGVEVQRKLDAIINRGEKEDAAFQSIWERFSRAVLQEAKQSKRMDKLIDNIEAYDKLAETLQKTTARKEVLLKKIEDFKYSDPAEAKKLVDDAMNMFLENKRDLNAKRAVRAEKLRERAKELDPQAKADYRAKELDSTNTALDDLETNFKDSWSAKGADELDIKTGKSSFAMQAMNDARELYRRLIGTPYRTSGLAVLTGERGAQLQRYLNLPFDVKKKYLLRDPERVVRAHAHHMMPDLEMYRATGSVNGARIISDIEEDFDRQLAKVQTYTHILDKQPVNGARLTPEELARATPITQTEREALSVELNDSRKSVLEDMKTVIDRVRHQRGIPDSPDGFMYRAGRVIQNLVVTTKMGTVAISSIPELARPVFINGVGGAWRGWWRPLLTDFSQIKFTAREAYKAGIGLDPILHNRPQAMFDIGQNYATRQSVAERGLEFLANKTGALALFDRWTQLTKTMSASTAVTEMTDAISTIMRATDSRSPEFANAMELLTKNNLDMDSIKRIWAQMEKPDGSTEFKYGVKLPNTEVWDDFEALMAYRAAVNKVADDMIVTPGLDRPAWMDKNAAFRMVGLLRSYGFTATNRIVMAGLQQPDMVFMQGAIMSLALGAVSYYTWAATTGGKSLTEANKMDVNQWIYESVNRSGLLGILSEGQRIGEQVPALNDFMLFGGNERSSRVADDMVGAIVGPAYGLAKRLIQTVQGIDDPTQSTLHAARVALVPYQNVFYLRRLFDAMESNLADTLGLPERRN